MNGGWQSFELYEELRKIIPNLPKNEVISAVIRMDVNKLPTVEITQYLTNADGGLAVENKEVLKQTRKFKIIPDDEE